MIVLDASALLELLLGTDAGRSVAERLDAPEETFHAPHLVDVEVMHALRRYVKAAEIDAEKAQQALNDLAALRLTRYGHTLLLPRAWEFRRSMSAYEAVYVALAEALNAPLLTRDAKLARAHGHRARILLV